MGYLSGSVTAFLLHPMLARRVLTGPHGACIGWGTTILVPDAQSYTRSPLPAAAEEEFTMPQEDWERLTRQVTPKIYDWFNARHIEIMDHNCAVFDPRTKKLYIINMVVKKHGKVCVVLVFFTPNRIPRRQHTELFEYANKVHGVCAEIYAMSPTTLILNAFFKTPAEGGDTAVCAISRPSPPAQQQDHAPRTRRRTAGNNPRHQPPPPPRFVHPPPPRPAGIQSP